MKGEKMKTERDLGEACYYVTKINETVKYIQYNEKLKHLINFKMLINLCL